MCYIFLVRKSQVRLPNSFDKHEFNLKDIGSQFEKRQNSLLFQFHTYGKLTSYEM